MTRKQISNIKFYYYFSAALVMCLSVFLFPSHWLKPSQAKAPWKQNLMYAQVKLIRPDLNQENTDNKIDYPHKAQEQMTPPANRTQHLEILENITQTQVKKPVAERPKTKPETFEPKLPLEIVEQPDDLRLRENSNQKTVDELPLITETLEQTEPFAGPQGHRQMPAVTYREEATQIPATALQMDSKQLKDGLHAIPSKNFWDEAHTTKEELKTALDEKPLETIREPEMPSSKKHVDFLPEEWHKPSIDHLSVLIPISIQSLDIFSLDKLQSDASLRKVGFSSSEAAAYNLLLVKITNMLRKLRLFGTWAPKSESEVRSIQFHKEAVIVYFQGGLMALVVPTKDGLCSLYCGIPITGFDRKIKSRIEIAQMVLEALQSVD